VPRYRYPLDPLIAVMAAGALALLVQGACWAVRRGRRPMTGDAQPTGEARPTRAATSTAIPEASR
jgi:hypothetical protein